MFFVLKADKFQFVTGDGHEYKYVANALINGKGFVSYEWNMLKRAYLGDNYFYVGDPVYPLFLTSFYLLNLSDEIIVLLSNLILYLFICYIFTKIINFYIYEFKIKYTLLLFICLNLYLQYYSFKLLTELLRVFIFVIFFYLLFKLYKSKNTIKKQTLIYFGMFIGVFILTRISFMFVPLLLIPLIIKKLENKWYYIVFYFVGFLIIIVPWVYRNYHNFGLITLDVRLSKTVFENATKDYTILRITDNKKYVDLKDMSNNEKKRFIGSFELKPFEKIKLYILRIKELFKPFPTGEPYNKFIFQIFTFIFNIPYLFGLIYFLFNPKHYKNIFTVTLILSVLSFIGIHIINNGPHYRYMLPLVPLGYLYCGIYIQNKINFNGG